jgi:hypothetical protein
VEKEANHNTRIQAMTQPEALRLADVLEATDQMHDNTRSFIDWDGELESMYRSFGQWK